VPRVPRDNVLHLYDEGVSAFEAAAAGLPPDGWDLTACGEWTAAELARHVLAAAGWYHEWLDRAERGDAAPAFGVEELGAHNALALAELAHLDGPAAVGQFVARARAYGARLPASWDLPFGFPRGTVTAGLHAAMAGSEWHLHTWDLARSRGGGHRPSDPAALYEATGECLAVVEGGVKGRVAGLLVPLGSRLRPWEAMLRRSGRAPGADD
jgi:Mycothiol maleylpyruvate isomerase N-terminal domain